MSHRAWAYLPPVLLGSFLTVQILSAQTNPQNSNRETPQAPGTGQPADPQDQGGPPRFGPGGPGGRRGPGGPMSEERKLVKQFDKDGDKHLNKEERQAARDFLKKEQEPGGGRRFGPPGGGPGGPGFGGGPGGPGGPGGGRRGPFGPGGMGGSEPGKPGPKITMADVKSYPSETPLYSPTALRTLFLEFEDKGWEQELADFHNTDVEVPATLTVDGKKYPNVGVHFRGMSSYMMVGAGSKRSLNLSMDFVDKDQRLYGYKTLNLLNSHEDPSFMHTVLYFDAARKHIPAPKANFVKVAINGESWGVYVNAQQYDKKFIEENFPKDTDGARWKVSGSPGGDGGLQYLGEDVAEYKKRYDMKSGDDKNWKDLIALCKTLSQTPLNQLEATLKSKLDVDGALWFLALENALINSDGYWIRASDYTIYEDSKGIFHVIPHDANETFSPGGGPGFGGGPGGPGGRGGGRGRFGPGGPNGNNGPGGQGRPADAADGQGRPGPDEGPGGPPPQDVFAGGPPPSGPFSGPGGPPPGGFGGPGGPGGFGGPGGPGGFGGRSTGGVKLDPLFGMDDTNKPLRSRLLAVPSLKARYLDHVRTLAQDNLDWAKLKPVVQQYRTLIEKAVEGDTRKLTSYDAFKLAVAETSAPATENAGPGRGNEMGLRAFADQRRAFLLNHSEIKKVAQTPK